MPFEIVRNDIVNMSVDAIVNTANPKPIIGGGSDFAIHEKAGEQLLEERKKIGDIAVGDAKITPAFDLPATYVIHTVGPMWKGGGENEEKLLALCYERSLTLAKEHHCESVAFPLISAGTYGFPSQRALQIAIGVFSEFLLYNEMQIYLVVFNKDAFSLSQKLFSSVKSYIDDRYIEEKTVFGYKNRSVGRYKMFESQPICFDEEKDGKPDNVELSVCVPGVVCKQSDACMSDLQSLLRNTDAGFSETLLKLIDKTGKKDSDIYKKANIDRKLFSKIRNNPNYKPQKTTALAFAIALELNLSETKDLIARAGYALTHSSKFDIIIEYFIENKSYDIFEINETLFAFDQSLLGA